MANPPLKDLEVLDEPKTLSEAELNSYREAAREIVNTHSKEEATRIFLTVQNPPTQPPPAPAPPLAPPPTSTSGVTTKLLNKDLGKRNCRN